MGYSLRFVVVGHCSRPQAQFSNNKVVLVILLSHAVRRVVCLRFSLKYFKCSSNHTHVNVHHSKEWSFFVVLWWWNCGKPRSWGVILNSSYLLSFICKFMSFNFCTTLFKTLYTELVWISLNCTFQYIFIGHTNCANRTQKIKIYCHLTLYNIHNQYITMSLAAVVKRNFNFEWHLGTVRH